MNSRLLPACLLIGLALPAAYAQTSQPAPTTIVTVQQPAATTSLRDLELSAQRLRASIQVLAQKAPGPERRIALDEARKALRETQQAMLDLPPQDRFVPSRDGSAGYDPSVRELMKSADALRDSIHAMAHQPAGPRRNQAIHDANVALLDIQSAMANAYDMTASRPTTTTLAVNSMKCEMLAGVEVCH